MFPFILRYISVQTVVSVVSSVPSAIVTVRSVAARAKAASGATIIALELALASPSKYGCLSLAGPHNILEFRDHIVVLVDGLQVSQEVFGGITKKTDVVGSLAMALGHFQHVVIILSLLVCINKLVQVDRL